MSKDWRTHTHRVVFLNSLVEYGFAHIIPLVSWTGIPTTFGVDTSAILTPPSSFPLLPLSSDDILAWFSLQGFADQFAAAPTALPTASPAMGAGGALAGNNGNGAMHARAESNGAEDFSDFQGSSSTPVASSGAAAAGGETGSMATGAGGAATNGGVTNPKWRDVSSLVDLGGLSSNTEKKASLLYLFWLFFLSFCVCVVCVCLAVFRIFKTAVIFGVEVRMQTVLVR